MNNTEINLIYVISKEKLWQNVAWSLKDDITLNGLMASFITEMLIKA